MTRKTQTNIHQQTTLTHKQCLQSWCIHFFALNLLLLLLISIRYLQHSSLPEPLFARLFTVAAFGGHFFSLILACTIVVLLVNQIPPWRRLLKPLAIGLASTLTTAICVDTFVYAQYHFHLNKMVLSLLTGGAATEIFSFSLSLWGMLIFGILFIIAIQIMLSHAANGDKLNRFSERYGRGALATLVLIFAGQNLAYALADAHNYYPIQQQIRYLPAYRPLTVKSTLHALGIGQGRELDHLSHIDYSDAASIQYPASETVCENPSPAYNILLIAIDSWRFDQLNASVTPNIERFAQHAWRFEQHYSAAISTRIGVFTLFYGIPGTYWHAVLQQRQPPLFISRLQQEKYQFGIFASSALTSPAFHHTVFSSVRPLRMRSSGRRPYQRDENITAEAIDFLRSAKASKQPFFAFLFYDAAHAYDVPPDVALPFQPQLQQVNYLALNQNFDPQPLINRYKNALYFNDVLIAKVLNELQQLDLQERTIVVITSDHGQEFNDNGQNYWGHNSNFSQYQTRVPLIVKWPESSAAQYAHLSSHYDITYTLLRDALGCEEALLDASLSGRNLRDPRSRYPLILSAYNRYALLQPNSIISVEPSGLIDAFDYNYVRQIQPILEPEAQQAATQQLTRFFKSSEPDALSKR